MNAVILFLVVAILGLSIGSFLAVFTEYLMGGNSPLRLRSKCNECNQSLRFNDLIPVVSYVSLRGKCRYCGSSINPINIIIEILSCISAITIYLKFGVTWGSIVIYSLFLILIILSITDILEGIVPDQLTIPAIWISIIISLWEPVIKFETSVVGSSLSAGSLLLLSWTYEAVRNKKGLGMGDIKLSAIIGAILGVLPFLIIVVMAAAMAIIYIVVKVIIRGKENISSPIPFVPFIAFGAMLYIMI